MSDLDPALVEAALGATDAGSIAAAVAHAPEFPCTGAANAALLHEIFERAAPPATLASLLVALYADMASPATYAAAGRLATARSAAVSVAGNASVSMTLDRLPRVGHVGVSGDLVIGGDLRVVGALVVTGNLVVGGTLSDCGPDSRIVVLGDLRCRSLSTSGSIAVAGDVLVRDALWACYNDDTLEVCGRLEAGIVVSDDHAIEASSITAKHTPSSAEGSWGPSIFDNADRAHLDELGTLLAEGLVGDEGVDGVALTGASPPWR